MIAVLLLALIVWFAAVVMVHRMARHWRPLPPLRVTLHSRNGLALCEAALDPLHRYAIRHGRDLEVCVEEQESIDQEESDRWRRVLQRRYHGLAELEISHDLSKHTKSG